MISAEHPFETRKETQHRFFLMIAGAAIIATPFHFWPFENMPIWQSLSIPNLACGLAVFWVFVLLFFKNTRTKSSLYIPHISILAYLIINILGMAFTNNFSRSLNFTIKLTLILLGGWFLFQLAIPKLKNMNTCYYLIAIATGIAVVSSLFTRLMFDPTRYGFFDSSLKYGTYVGIFVPLSSIFLVSGGRTRLCTALLLSAGGVLSAGSAGAWLAIFAGLIAAMIITNKKTKRAKIFFCIVLSAAGLFASDFVFEGQVRREFALTESDNINVKQRYIEWQAFINITKERGIIGTGPGNINEYRSAYYHRLPKLNTIKSFDQNGFLAVSAEAGILGLVTWLWILIHFGRISVADSLRFGKMKNFQFGDMALANVSAFVGALIASLFSALHYNGILIIFILLLSLISSIRYLGENSNEN